MLWYSETSFNRHSLYRVFSRDVVLGGEIAFVGREKCEKYPKNKRNLLLFGGEIQNLGGEISPPKGPEKNTVSVADTSLNWIKHAVQIEPPLQVACKQYLITSVEKILIYFSYKTVHHCFWI